MGRRWDRIELAELALSVERDRLGITAGLQDRLVQAVSSPVLMNFDPVSFEIAQIRSPLPLFVAWHSDAAESSDTVHRSVKDRFDAGEPDVVTAMQSLAIQAKRAHRALIEDRGWPVFAVVTIGSVEGGTVHLD